VPRLPQKLSEFCVFSFFQSSTLCFAFPPSPLHRAVMAKSDAASGIKICCIGAGYVGGKRKNVLSSLCFNRCFCSRVVARRQQPWRARFFPPEEPLSTPIPLSRGVGRVVSLPPRPREAPSAARLGPAERRRLCLALPPSIGSIDGQLLGSRGRAKRFPPRRRRRFRELPSPSSRST